MAALRLLMALQIRGFLRSRRPLSIAITMALVAMLFWVRAVDPARVAVRSAIDLDGAVRAFMMLALVALTIATATVARGRTVAFTPAEIDGLFPGPFGDTQLVLYKVGFIAIGATWPAVLVAIVYRRVAGVGLAGPIGMWLAFVHVHLLAMLGQAAWYVLRGGSRSPAARAGALLAMGMLLAALVELAAYVVWGTRTVSGFLACVAGSWVLWILLTPFELVADVYTARTAPVLLRGTALSLLLMAGMVWALIGLERPLIERSVASREVFARAARRARRGHRSLGPARGLTRVRLGMLPRLGGVGPTAWVRLVAALRAPTRIAAVTALTFLATFLVTLAGPTSRPGVAVAVGVLWLIVMPATVPFDFRLEAGDLALWKTLPIGRVALGLGQLATPWALLTLLGWAALGAGALAAPTVPPILVWAVCFVPPAALLAAGIENALFLAFPEAAVPAGDVDPVAAVHGWFFLLGRVVVWTLVGVTAAVAATFAGRVLASELAGVAVAWLAVAFAAVASVAVVAWLAGRFDPTSAVPPA